MALNQLGTLVEDTFVQAKELLKAKHPKGKLFSFVSCWEVLKEVPKWHKLGPLVKMKKGVDQSKSRLPLAEKSNAQSLVDDGSPPPASSESFDCQSGLKRPQGNKVAKDQFKCQKLQEEVSMNQARAS